MIASNINPFTQVFFTFHVVCDAEKLHGACNVIFYKTLKNSRFKQVFREDVVQGHFPQANAIRNKCRQSEIVQI